LEERVGDFFGLDFLFRFLIKQKMIAQKKLAHLAHQNKK